MTAVNDGMPLLPALLHLDDDTLECIIHWRLVDARRIPNYDAPFQAVDAIAQVCRRLRRLALGRANFWRDLRVEEHTPARKVELLLSRAGADSSIDVSLQMKRSHPAYSGTKLDRPDAYLLAYAFLHRARTIIVTRGENTRLLPNVESDLVQPADYYSRPLEYLSFNNYASDVMLQLIGPQLARIDLCHIPDPISFGRLEQVLAAAPRLVSFTLINTVIKPVPAVAERSISAPSPAPSRAHGLSYLTLENPNCGARVTELLCRYYPLTPAKARSIQLALFRTDFDLLEIDNAAIWINTKILGSPMHIRLSRSGGEWELHFSEGRTRELLVSSSRLNVPSAVRSTLQDTLAVCSFLEFRDAAVISPVSWFKLWLGDTWGELSRLEINLRYIAHRGAHDEELWRPREMPRIHLPALESLVIFALHDGDFNKKWGAQCAAILDILDIPITVIIDIRPSRSKVEELKVEIDAAYVVRHGCTYFDRRSA